MQTQTYTKINTLYQRFKISEQLLAAHPEYVIMEGKIDVHQYSEPLFGYLFENLWDCFSKIDGTNTKIVFYPSNGEIAYGGKTDRAQLHNHDKIMPAICGKIVQPLRELFPETSAKYVPIFSSDGSTIISTEEVPVYIYGELFGQGIQACGKEYSTQLRFAVFDVCAQGYWLPTNSLMDFCEIMKLEMVPYLGQMTLKAAENLVMDGFKTWIPNVKNPNFIEEGIVARPAVPLYDVHKHRVLVKIKHCDYAQLTNAVNQIGNREFDHFRLLYRASELKGTK